MSSSRSPAAGRAAAAVMAVGTLALFANLQHRGPENVVRRFVDASFRGDVPELERLLVQPPLTDWFANQLVGYTRSFRGTGARLRVVRTDRAGDVAAVVTVMVVDRQTTIGQRWLLVQDRDRWRIDARAMALGARLR